MPEPGSGRLSLPPADLGRAVTGIDKAPAILAAARRKAAQVRSTARFFSADLRSLSLDGFANHARSGGCDRTPIGSRSPQQLLVCRKLSD